MNIRLFLLSIVFLSLLSQEAISQSGDTQNYIEGYVYEDLNQNGEKDQDEVGVTNVMVSNQREVILTDENGYYKLPINEPTSIFVSKPAGYDLRLNENNLPQYYYIHQPKGSPNLKYGGIDPTGSLPTSLDFGLTPSQKKESFRAIIFGDPQPRDNQELSYYRDAVVSELANIDADLTLVLGDIMFDDLSLYDRYNRIMKTLAMPVYNLFGNHDINYDAKGNRYARETFKKHYGPSYFSFEYGEVHFIALNNIDYLGIENDTPYRGYLDDKQLEWIKNTLNYIDNDKLVVLMSHIPLYSDDGTGKKKNTVNRGRLVELLEDRDKVLYLSAHRHRIFHDFLGEEVGINSSEPMHHIALTAASGAWWDGPMSKTGIPLAMQRDGVPNGYHIFRFENNTYQERYKGAGHGADYQMRIERPESSLSLSEYKNNSKILVNVFNGNEKSKVLFKIDNKSEWKEMSRLKNHYSPFFDKVMHGYRKPGHTNHMWQAELPDLDKGIHKITVLTRDMYGREYTQTKVIEIN